MNRRPRKRLNVWRVLILYIALGLVFGFLSGLVLPAPMFVTMYLGTLIAILLSLPHLADALPANPKHDREVSSRFGKLPPRGDAPPAGFNHRLAHYLHRDEASLNEPRPPYESKMPFWSLVDFRSWYGPKPAWLIRQVLERIRASVRGALRR